MGGGDRGILASGRDRLALAWLAWVLLSGVVAWHIALRANISRIVLPRAPSARMQSSTACDKAKERGRDRNFRFHDLMHTWHVQSITSLLEAMELGGWN
jgi:hypothetical protein